MREHSLAAAILVALGYVVSVLMVLLVGRFPGLLDVAIGAVLLANVRGTWIASRWKRQADPDLFPHRLGTTFTDRLIDQWPAWFWPRGRFVFFTVAAIYAALMVLGIVGTMRLQAVQQASPQEIELQAQPPSR